MQQYLYEVFEDISKSKNKDAAVAKMKKYNEVISANSDRDALAFRTLLQGTVDLAIIWGLPTYDIQYHTSQQHNAPNNLFKELPKVAGYFEVGNPEFIQDRRKREEVFLTLLEGLTEKDAELLIDMTRHKSRYKHITATVVREAFGDDFLQMDKYARKP